MGPKTTPYEKGLFIMFVNFPDNYPGFLKILLTLKFF